MTTPAITTTRNHLTASGALVTGLLLLFAGAAMAISETIYWTSLPIAFAFESGLVQLILIVVLGIAAGILFLAFGKQRVLPGASVYAILFFVDCWTMIGHFSPLSLENDWSLLPVLDTAFWLVLDVLVLAVAFAKPAARLHTLATITAAVAGLLLILSLVNPISSIASTGLAYFQYPESILNTISTLAFAAAPLVYALTIRPADTSTSPQPW
ncbi:MAG: hypothetical protein LBR20_03405 [Propionibacteriaceae bacterium]|jgi:hypothetical protein|nr:hypothetical protein [Propionibacteriaceae bacterium]